MNGGAHSAPEAKKALRATLHIKSIFALIACFSCFSLAAASERNELSREITVRSVPISGFSRTQPAKARFGRLEFLGALSLSSDDKDFGGWSGLTISRTGQRLLLVSDAGHWLRADIDYREGRPKTIENARIGALRAKDGMPLATRRNADAEAIHLLSGDLNSGTALIAFERNQRIGIFPIGTGGPAAPTRYLTRPLEARRMKSNRGFEAVTVIPSGPFKGRILAFAESLMLTSGYHTGWLWSHGENSAPRSLRLRDYNGFDITDAVSLTSGSIVILERRFRWTEGVSMQLREIDGGDIRPGATLTGSILLTADMTHEIDNMEGIAAHFGKEGSPVLTLISDNNFNTLLQRTILLQFRLHPAGK